MYFPTAAGFECIPEDKTQKQFVHFSEALLSLLSRIAINSSNIEQSRKMRMDISVSSACCPVVLLNPPALCLDNTLYKVLTSQLDAIIMIIKEAEIKYHHLYSMSTKTQDSSLLCTTGTVFPNSIWKHSLLNVLTARDVLYHSGKAHRPQQFRVCCQQCRLHCS